MKQRVVLAGAVVLGLAALPAGAQESSMMSSTTDMSSMGSMSSMDMSSMDSSSSMATDTIAQVPASADEIPVTPVTDPQEFATKATVGNLFEVQSSQLALQKSTDGDVKSFAEMMIADHTKAGTEAAEAASAQNGVSLPTDLDAKHADMLNQLNAASGADFDKLYIQFQTAAHIEAVGLFAGFSQNGQAGPLKDFATATLPTLKMHYQHVLGLQDKAA